MQGTDRSHDCLNIFLEYVPGGSIASLLAKFGIPLFNCDQNQQNQRQHKVALQCYRRIVQYSGASCSKFHDAGGVFKWLQDICKLVSVTDEADKVCMKCRVIQGICHQDLCSPDLARAQVSA